MIESPKPGSLSAATFVDVFVEGWALPKPDAFLEYFRPHIHPDAAFEQPVFRTGHGPDGFERVFNQLFVQIPDLVLTVANSAWGGEVVFIESRCQGTLGGHPIELEVCDRFTLADGRIIERRSYSDPLPSLLATAKRPRTWGRAVRSLRTQ